MKKHKFIDEITSYSRWHLYNANLPLLDLPVKRNHGRIYM